MTSTGPQDLRAGRVRSLLRTLRPTATITIGVLGHPSAESEADPNDDLFSPTPTMQDTEKAKRKKAKRKAAGEMEAADDEMNAEDEK